MQKVVCSLHRSRMQAYRIVHAIVHWKNGCGLLHVKDFVQQPTGDGVVLSPCKSAYIDVKLVLLLLTN